MDAVTLAAANAASARARRSIVVSQFASLRSKLDRGLESASVVVLGDSTGAGTVSPDKRWPQRFAESLAAAYPAYTVRAKPWNLTNNNYDAFVTVATGTGTGNAGGPFTIDIYNGSASGQAPAYSRLWLLGSNGMIPYGVMPDLIFVNHSHNMGTAVDITVQAAFYALIRDALRWYNPAAAVICLGQNPETSGTTTAQHLQRMARIAELCAAEGWGFLNVTQAFLDNPSWASTLIKADGIHPNDTGNALWASLIWSAFQSAGAYALPSAARMGADRILVPASAFTPALTLGGSPSAAVLSNFLPVMSYTKQAGLAGASCVVQIPPQWRQVNVWVWWTTSDTGAGNVSWNLGRVNTARVTQEINSGTGSLALAIAATGVAATGAAPGVALAESHTLLWAGTGLGWGSVSPQSPRAVVLRLDRDGGSGGDTYAGTAQVFGLLLERAA